MKIRKRAVVTIAIASVLAGCGEEERKQPAPQQRAEAPQLPATQSDRIVFTLDGDITAMDPDGSGRITLLKSDELEVEPTWSPDGRRIAFVRDDGALYVMNADGTGVKRVTDPRPGTEGPAWSADGRRLTFTSEAGDAFALYVVRVDGTGLRRLRTVKQGWLGAADFSPDDQRIVFARDPSEAGGQMDIWITDTAGRSARRLTHFAGDESAPRWRPDGQRVLFGAGGRGIFTINPDGTQRRRLIGDALNADTLNAVWSPDGKRIAWTAKFKGGGGSEVYVMNADGGDVKPITDRLPGETQADW